MNKDVTAFASDLQSVKQLVGWLGDGHAALAELVEVLQNGYVRQLELNRELLRKCESLEATIRELREGREEAAEQPEAQSESLPVPPADMEALQQENRELTEQNTGLCSGNGQTESAVPPTSGNETMGYDIDITGSGDSVKADTEQEAPSQESPCDLAETERAVAEASLDDKPDLLKIGEEVYADEGENLTEEKNPKSRWRWFGWRTP